MGPRAGELAEQVEAVAAQAGGPVAVVFAGNGLAAAVGDRPHAQAKRVGQADESHELAQLVPAAQMTGFQVKAPPFQILKALLNRPALGVQLLEVVQAGRGKKEDERVRRHGLDPDLPPDPVDLHMGEAAHLPRHQAQVGHGLPPAVGMGQAVVLGQPHDKIQSVVFQPLEPRMTDKLPVADDQADAVFAEQGHADFEYGDAVGGVGVTAAVIEQVPVKRHVDLARADGDE